MTSDVHDVAFFNCFQKIRIERENGAIFTVIRTEFMKIMQNHDIFMTCHYAKKKIWLAITFLFKENMFR